MEVGANGTWLRYAPNWPARQVAPDPSQLEVRASSQFKSLEKSFPPASELGLESEHVGDVAARYRQDAVILYSTQPLVVRGHRQLLVPTGLVQ